MISLFLSRGKSAAPPFFSRPSCAHGWAPSSAREIRPPERSVRVSRYARGRDCRRLSSPGALGRHKRVMPTHTHSHTCPLSWIRDPPWHISPHGCVITHIRRGKEPLAVLFRGLFPAVRAPRFPLPDKTRARPQATKNECADRYVNWRW